MTERCFTFLTDDDEPPPPTSRAPAAELARWVAQTVPAEERSEAVTPFTGVETVTLIAIALGADEEAFNRIRESYANGDTGKALACAEAMTWSLRDDVLANLDEDPFGGLIPLDDDDIEEVVDVASAAE